jgi:hypothetical protein
MNTIILFIAICIFIGVLIGLTVGLFGRSISRTQYKRGFIEGYNRAKQEQEMQINEHN